MNEQRENFASRLGFILITAGCAIGLGNVWRFPYITGQYGGAAFVLIYLFFLAVFGLPILMAELAVGRASKRGIGQSFQILEKEGTKWHFLKFPMLAGNYILMMFYTTVSGWTIYFFYKTLTGGLENVTPEQVGQIFGNTLGNPTLQISYMLLATALGFGIVMMGLQKGVERITKWMMSCLLIIMIALAIRAVTLPGAEAGLEFYLMPDFSKLSEKGFGEVIFAALGQSFFTLSLGIGAMSIFGSYIGKTHSLVKESINICALDTSVALLAGLIIIPSCFAFGLNPDAGPSLIFMTIPNVFSQMPGGRFFGAAFFLFLSFAALSTLIAVFENITSFWMDSYNFKRKKVVIANMFAIMLLSIPCALGFNILSDITPFGADSSILDLEDFIVSNTLLPLGSLFFIIFCNSKRGWGQEKFYTEINSGKGLKFPTHKVVRFYIKWVLPLIIIFIFIQGYTQKFAPEIYKKIFG